MSPKEPPEERTCPGEKYSITLAICRTRQRNRYPKCLLCPHRSAEVAGAVATDPKVRASIFHSTSVMGRVPQEVNEYVMRKVGLAAAQLLRAENPGGSRFLVACDGRDNSRSFGRVFCEGVNRGGMDAVSLGAAPPELLAFVLGTDGCTGAAFVGGGNWPAITEDAIPVAAPEGVYVFDSDGADHVRLFDHNGSYVRTIYPFPARKLKEAKGLVWRDYPQGYSRPRKNGLNQTTFLTSGGVNGHDFAMPAASAIAIRGSRIALVREKLNRLATDGSTGRPDIDGPAMKVYIRPPYRALPWSAAFSPDGKRLYVAGWTRMGYHTPRLGSGRHWLNGVLRLDYEKNEPPKVFVGTMKPDGTTPHVACDAKGRVYVTDYINDCVSVYDAEAKLLKKIDVTKPAYVTVDPGTGEVYVFSWALDGFMWRTSSKMKAFKGKVPRKMSVFKSADSPKLVTSCDLGGFGAGSTKNDYWMNRFGGTQWRAAVDFYTKPIMIWLAHGRTIRLMRPKDGKLELVRDFAKEVTRAVGWLGASGHQRLYVSPTTGKLYMTASVHSGVAGGGFSSLVEVDPHSGRTRTLPLPVSRAEDLAFDTHGRVCLRQVNPHRVVRYDLKTWREIPWDYGEAGIDKKRRIISGLTLPSASTGWYSQGGLAVSPKGHLAVWCAVKGRSLTVSQKKRLGAAAGGPSAYRPRMYPGRKLMGCIHIFDKHGKVLIEDAVPGVSMAAGLGIDARDNLYMLSWAPRVYNGKPYFNKISGTLLRVQPRKSKWLAQGASAIPLTERHRPDRSPDLCGYTMRGNVWVEGADWFFGGVGNCSFKIHSGCICWQHSRFALDYFARSFAPETDQFSVAVLDGSGNLILRIGQYGNEDDGMPAEGVPLGQTGNRPMLAPPHPRALGGDEVALMQPSYVATDTDQYLYIADMGNSRVVQVRLDYHAEEKVALKDVKDGSN